MSPRARPPDTGKDGLTAGLSILLALVSMTFLFERPAVHEPKRFPQWHETLCTEPGCTGTGEHWCEGEQPREGK